MDELKTSGQPSVLDYLKYKLAPWKYPPVELLPQGQVDSADEPQASLPVSSLTGDVLVDEPIDQSLLVDDRAAEAGCPWRALASFLLALAAQSILEHGGRRVWDETVALAVSLYLIAIGLGMWSCWRSEWQVASPASIEAESDNLQVRTVWLFVGIAIAGIAFILTANNLFTWLNAGLLMIALIFLIFSLWQRPFSGAKIGFSQFVTRPGLLLSILVILGISAYFRFAQLSQIPGEMNSDHAEKIIDILGVLSGKTYIFFPNNGGREALQLYLTAGMVKYLGLQPDFLLLKIISAGIGFITLPFIYLIGKEIANPRVGLIAMAFLGVAYWPNVVSRLGLRLPFYFLFSAVILYFLIRGLRRSKRNDFILLGLFLGVSFYGYSANRILPVIVLLGIAAYWLHAKFAPERENVIWYGLMAFVIAIITSLPMLRYFLEQPGVFLYRTLTRLGGMEQPLPAPAALIFLKNTWRALTMFSWSNGEIWTVSIPYRPALEVVGGALFWLGVGAVCITYLKRRNWIHLFLLISIPVLMLPSILALAFPSENPNLYRTAGAAIPVFLLIGLALDGLMTALEKRPNYQKTAKQTAAGHSIKRSILAWCLAVIVFFLFAYQSYDLVFTQYRQQYQLAAWNTSEIGQVIRDFAGTYGGVDNVWVMGYPYWVDTRLVGINAGFPLRDFAMFIDRIEQIPDNSEAKLFIINPQDVESIAALKDRFVNGTLASYPTKTAGKEFLMFLVPPQMG